MEWSLAVSTAPTIEPVTTQEAKEHLRITHADEDLYIARLITAARQYAETFTQRSFINRTLELKLEYFPSVILLPNPPASSITSITYLDTAGASQTLATTVYLADYKQEPGSVRLDYGQSWPSVRAIHNPITILYVAGYGSTAATVPAGIRQAILVIVGTSYEFREDVITGPIKTAIPEAAERLLWPHRTWLEYPWQ